MSSGGMPLRLQKYLKTSSISTTLDHTGFIIVRCIQDELTSQYWYECYKSIRKFYPQTPIVIIDDQSNVQFVNKQLESTLVHCRIVTSEKPHCGELLGYYHFFKYHWFKRAIIIHDSVFIKQKIDFNKYKKVRFIWHIETKAFDDIEWESTMLKKIGMPYYHFYEEKHRWKGCFGVMTIIDYDFLKKISQPLFFLVDEIKTRRHRSCMERILAVLCFYYCPELYHCPSIMGDIHHYPLRWGYHYTTFQHDQQQGKKFPSFVKVWTGR